MVFQAMPDQWNSIPQQELQMSDSEKQLHGQILREERVTVWFCPELC